MIWSRRSFLKLTGLSLLGLGVKPAWDALAGNEMGKFAKSPAALRGKQWGMVVDTGKCPIGCRECIDACHRIHNVPDFKNAKDEIKWIWKEPFRVVFPEHENHYLEDTMKERPVMILCNHCENPPCVRVCPTKATFKREEDGIVMMDYHRCIGCRFCVAGCPYGARSMNFRDPRPFVKEVNPEFPTRTKGVVEKCNFCVERLSQGLLPACVEACKDKALIFGDLSNPQAKIREIVQSRFTLRRKPELGTNPQVYYLL
jgi:Fe-S-cluster-containing dehydrogenase component